jgi:hypothetical protein
MLTKLVQSTAVVQVANSPSETTTNSTSKISQEALTYKTKAKEITSTLLTTSIKINKLNQFMLNQCMLNQCILQLTLSMLKTQLELITTTTDSTSKISPKDSICKTRARETTSTLSTMRKFKSKTLPPTSNSQTLVMTTQSKSLKMVRVTLVLTLTLTMVEKEITGKSPTMVLKMMMKTSFKSNHTETKVLIPEEPDNQFTLFLHNNIKPTEADIEQFTYYKQSKPTIIISNINYPNS